MLPHNFAFIIIKISFIQRVSKKKNETGSDAKKVLVAAEHAEWLILHYRYKFKWLSLVVSKGERVTWKLFKVTLSNLNFHDVVAGKETRSTCYGSILFLVRILTNTNICINENSIWERCSQSCNNIPLALIFHRGKSLGSHIIKWSTKNVQHRDCGEDQSHHNGKLVSDGQRTESHAW